jgi:putative membrane protein
MLIESLEGRVMLAASFTNKDVAYLKQESVGNSSEIALGRLALTNSTNADVRALAQRLIDDHTAGLQQVDQIAVLKNVQTLPVTDRSHQAVLNRLTKLTGKKFDVAFSAFEVSDHKKGLKKNQAEAKRTQDPDALAYASGEATVLSAHLALAQTALTSAKAESSGGGA